MSFPSEKPKGRRKLPCSTPTVENAHSLSSISISAVDTNSSSSTRAKTLRTGPEKKPTKRKKLQKKTLNEMKQEKQREKKAKKSEKRKRKKKKTIERRQLSSDDDWETYDESLRHPSELENNVLFDDVRSPEQIREAPHFVHDHLDSPILRPRVLEVASPKRLFFEEKEETLPVKDLPFFHVRFDDSDDEENVLPLRKENTVKTYLGMRSEKAPRSNEVRIEKCKEWLVNVAVPTVSSDLLWDNFVRENHEKISKYLAPPGDDKRKSRHDGEKDINDDNGDASEERDNRGEKSVKEKYEIPSKLREKMSVVRGHWDKSLHKWVRVNDVYNFPGNEDMEFGKRGETTGKITLNQFLQKTKERKRKMIELDSNSSSPTYQRSIEQNLKGSRSPIGEGKIRKKRSRENFESAMKRPKTVMADVSDAELQRINAIRKFASRLNARERKMISSDTSLASTSKDTKPNCTVSSLKRANENGVDDKQIGSKRLKLATTKNKPKIRSIQSLVGVQFERDKQNWRII